jgi:mono/diheme cytochrome c family protein
MNWIATGRKGLLGSVLAITLLPAMADVVYMDQGAKWTDRARATYYTQDQGSQLIPLKWMMALHQPNGEPFMADSLARFGYLPNPASKPAGLPVGFTVNRDKAEFLGMTCSACHTRQIDVKGQAYRIDGGPAIVDFQNFMSELDSSVAYLLGNEGEFARFAKAVLGSRDSKPARDKLRAEVDAWYLPYHTIVKGSLPVDSPWGPSRLDAVSMIFNRVSGLDIGPAPTYMIPENIKLADAPARYPFLWNAPIQDFTQWPGFSENGNLLLGLSRNLGEVIGVFAKFHPQKAANIPGGINYTGINSGNFAGLNRLEVTIEKLGPPKWPWALDPKLVAEGEAVFKKKDAEHGNSSCEDCHGIRTGEIRSLFHKTWATPILDVGTDSREVNLLSSTVKTGVFAGVSFAGSTMEPVDAAFKVLSFSVGGSIAQHYLSLKPPSSKSVEAKVQQAVESKFSQETGSKLKDIGTVEKAKTAMKAKVQDASGPYRYESRVLQGIWAAAPYLHNGSVPTLAELLKPAASRVAQFKVGPNYDIEQVGLAAEQTRFNFTLKTTDCAERNSGNSRCGHEFGTTFSEAEKRALLEYMKKL